MRGCSGGERGAATVLATAMLGVLLLVGAALGVVVAMVADHRRAQAAADLAALAGADEMGGAGGVGAACGAAGRVATLNDALLESCTVAGADVLVTVRVVGPRWLGQSHDLTARARAGPGP